MDLRVSDISTLRQTGNVVAGFQDEFSYKSLITETALGFGLGGVAGGLAAKLKGQNFWWGNSTKIPSGGGIGIGEPVLYANEHIKGLNRGAQTKHIPGSHNYDPSRSQLLADPNKLLDKVYTLDYEFVRYNPRGMPVLKFNYPVGIYSSHGTSIGVTNLATMSFQPSTGLVHFIPAWPIP